MSVDAARKVINELGDGAEILPSHERFNWFLSLFYGHPEHVQKLAGRKISGFRLQKNALGRGIGAYVLFEDGTAVDFSWRIAAGAKVPSKKTLLRQAMRAAVDAQIRAVPHGVCGICGDLPDFYHIDHVVPFETLATEFESSGAVPTSFADCPKSNRPVFRAEDAAFERGWAEFHRSHALLRITCATCNLKRKRSI